MSKENYDMFEEQYEIPRPAEKPAEFKKPEKVVYQPPTPSPPIELGGRELSDNARKSVRSTLDMLKNIPGPEKLKRPGDE